MAAREDFARWIVENADKKGTPHFEAVSQAFMKLNEGEPGPGLHPSQQAFAPEPIDWASMGPMEQFAAGMGKSFADLGMGINQRLGNVDEADVAAMRQRDAGLMETLPGKIGNVSGTLMATVPAAFIPGAQTVAGSAALGGILGMLQPTGEGESALTNTALGAGLGAAGQWGSNKLAQALMRRINGQQTAKAANQAKDAVLREVVDEGYTIPPSYARGGRMARLAEGLSGKYKTNQLAGIRNQGVTNRLAARSLGLADDTPITDDVLKGLRSTAFQQGYQPIRGAGRIQADPQFMQALDDAVAPLREAAADFPELVDDQIIRAVDSVRKDEFETRSALSAIRILRDKASKFFRDGEGGAGRAAREAAQALEDQIERHLSGLGDDGAEMLNNFREARTLIAKTHTVEEALQGSSNVDATRLAQALKRGKPLSGDLETIARFGQEFHDVARVPKSGDANPFTIMDAFTGAGGATLTGNPLMLSLPAARVGAREVVLSRPVQNAMATKSYDPSIVSRALLSPSGRLLPRTAALAGISPLLSSSEER